jgi:hypothetical protein
MKHKYEAQRTAFIGLGAVFALLGVVEFLESPQGRPTGRWSAILGPLHDHFGQNGVAIAFILIGAVLITLGTLISKER